MSALWLSTLADAAMRATVVLGIAAAIAALPRHRSAALRHFIWALALAGALVLPLVGAVLPAVPIPVPWSVAGPQPATAVDANRAGAATPIGVQAPAVNGHAAGAAANTLENPADSRAATRTGAVPRRAATGGAGSASPAAANVPSTVAWNPLWLLSWGAGAATLAAWSLCGIRNIRRLVAHATPVTADEWLAPLDDARARLGIRRPVRLLRSDHVAMPMTWGWRRPVILVPPAADGWPAPRRAVVLRHELAHVRRADVVTQLLAQLACAVYWFNPVICLAAFRLRVERERACDDEVLRLGTRASDYANHLLDIARECHVPGRKASAAVAMARPSQLEHRVRTILDPTVRRAAGRAAATLAAVILTGSVLAVSALTPTTGTLPGRNAAGGRGPHATAGTARSAASAEPAGAAATGRAGATLAAGPQGEPEGLADWHRLAQEVFATVVWHLSEARRQLGGATAGAQQVAESDEAAAPPAQADRQDDQLQQARWTVWGDSLTIDVGPEWQETPRTITGENVTIDFGPEWREGPEEIDSRLAKTFMGALSDPDANVRARAAQALGRHRVHAAATVLHPALGDEDADVRKRVAWALGRIRDDASVDRLLSLLRDPVQEVRERAAWALGTLRSPAAVDGLVAALEDADDAVQERIAWALGRIRDPRATRGLITALNVNVGDARHEVIEALARIGGEPAMEALIGLMDADDPEVRRAVVDALSRGNWIAPDESADTLVPPGPPQG